MDFLRLLESIRFPAMDAAGQADFPLPVGGDKLIVVGRSLRCELAVFLLRRQLLDLLLILRIVGADGILKLKRLFCLDFQNVGKTQLADNLQQLIFGIDAAALL